TGTNQKVIHLGGSVQEELTQLYLSLAASNVPLNEDDRLLLSELTKQGFIPNLIKCPVRENKAIINAALIENNKIGYVSVDTLTDVLRLSCQLSGGDVT